MQNLISNSTTALVAITYGIAAVSMLITVLASAV